MACLYSSICILSAVTYNIDVNGSVNFTGNRAFCLLKQTYSFRSKRVQIKHFLPTENYRHLSQGRTKPTKCHVRQRGLRSAWASAKSDQSSLSAWRKLGSLATYWEHSKDWSDWVDAQADLSLCWAHMPFGRFCHVLVHFSYTSMKTYVVCTH